MSSIHLWGAFVLLIVTLNQLQSVTLVLYCSSMTDYVEVPIDNADTLVGNMCFNVSKETFFWAFGFNGSMTGPASSTIIPSLLSTNRNVITCNWQQEASSITITPSLNPLTGAFSYITTAIEFVFIVGVRLGLAILKMIGAGMTQGTTYLLGHSLGAQLVGQAGRTCIANGIQLPMIFGLDPAGRAFGQRPELPSLSSGDAKDVFVLHSDPGGYGINESLADVDLYANFLNFVQPNTQTQVQPGCPIGNFPLLSTEDLCSHNFCWRWFAEGVRNPNASLALLGSKAANVWDWTRGLGNCSDIVQVAVHWDITRRGVYFMNTSATSPYGLGYPGACPTA